MIRLTDILTEACWDGYKQVGMKKKGDRQVPNCVPVNENETQSVECAECGWEWDLSDGGKDPYLCHKCGHDNTDDYDELDVEDEDEEDFINFLKGYTTEINEAEYQGRDVKLGKPMQGDVKKFKVYVKNPSTGKIIKVNFGHGGTSAASAGEETMRIRKSNPDARRAFRARHNCDEPGPRTKARYWSCKKW
jgi:Zn ribbon nucleic-acid-binding protein